MLSSRNGQSKESVCWCSQGSNGEQQSFHARAVQSWCDTCVRTDDADADDGAMVVDPQNFASLMDASLDAMVRPKRFRICSAPRRRSDAQHLSLLLGPQGKLDQIGKPQQPA